jgi:hypothetical protein
MASSADDPRQHRALLGRGALGERAQAIFPGAAGAAAGRFRHARERCLYVPQGQRRRAGDALNRGQAPHAEDAGIPRRKRPAREEGDRDGYLVVGRRAQELRDETAFLQSAAAALELPAERREVGERRHDVILRGLS